jgi:hypothetical protein
MARYRHNLLTVGWVTVVLGALHLADHAGVVLSAFGLLFWDCHLAVEAGPRRGRMRACGCLPKLSMRVGRFVSSIRYGPKSCDDHRPLRTSIQAGTAPESRQSVSPRIFLKVAASTRR